MEGLSGQTDWRTQEYRFSLVAGDLYDLVVSQKLKPIDPAIYAKGQDLLVGDVNAVVEGLFAGGADSVDVLDAHGSGNPEVDLPPDRLDRRARHLPVDARRSVIQPGSYDAVVLVGQHMSTGGRGFLSHTSNAGTRISYNGVELTEADLTSYAWGEVGVPVVLVSGDDRLGEDVKAKMPWAQYVAVKRALGPMAAELRPLDQARADLRQSAARALQDPAGWRVVRVGTPVEARICAVSPASFEKLSGVPGIDYRDGCVSFGAPDHPAVTRGTNALLELAAVLGYHPILLETVLAEPNGIAILDRSNENGGKHWEAAEAKAWR
jgi:D-amino peptidase